MKSLLKKLSIPFIFLFTLSLPFEETRAMPPKAKVFLKVVGYGTAGGALIGLASIPLLNAKSRAIFQGASLGLYAGIIFGSFLLVSHSVKKKPDESSGLTEPEYSEDVQGEYEAGGDMIDGEDAPLERWRFQTPSFTGIERGYTQTSGLSALKSHVPEFQINLINIEF